MLAGSAEDITKVPDILVSGAWIGQWSRQAVAHWILDTAQRSAFTSVGASLLVLVSPKQVFADEGHEQFMASFWKHISGNLIESGGKLLVGYGHQHRDGARVDFRD
jgi:hypothetical protein